MNKSEDPVQALTQQILEDRKSVAAETVALKRQSMSEVIGNGVYGPLKAGLDNLQNQPGSEVRVIERDYSEFLLDSDTVCSIETNLSYQKSSGADWEEDDHSSENDTADIYFSSSGITVPSLFSYRNEVSYQNVDVQKVLAHFCDEALNQGFLPAHEQKSETIKLGKAAALLLALGIGLVSFGHAIHNIRQGDKKTDQAIADEFTTGQPQHTRLENENLYFVGKKQSERGVSELSSDLAIGMAAYLLWDSRRKKAAKVSMPSVAG